MCCYWEQSNNIDTTQDWVISNLINEFKKRNFFRDITVL